MQLGSCSIWAQVNPSFDESPVLIHEFVFVFRTWPSHALPRQRAGDHYDRSMGIALLPTMKVIVKYPSLVAKPLEVLRNYPFVIKSDDRHWETLVLRDVSFYRVFLGPLFYSWPFAHLHVFLRGAGFYLWVNAFLTLVCVPCYAT